MPNLSVAAGLFVLCLQGGGDLESLKSAVSKVRSQASYRTTFKAEIQEPNSGPLRIEGTSVWQSPGVLYVYYKRSGGDEQRVVRVGATVWIYNPVIQDWLTAEEMQDPGAGQGVQNPDEVLGVIERHARNVVSKGEERVGERSLRALALDLSGGEIEGIMKEQATEGTFVWRESKASARLLVDPGDGLMYRFNCDADLKSADPNIGGRIRYLSEVDVADYGTAQALTFTEIDPQTGQPRTIPLGETIQKAIDEARKSPAPR